jgi:predicted extracellular nuclease
MKILYVLAATILLVASAYSQTNPTAQTLPYAQDFSGLASSSTTYPAGWQGWVVSTTPTGSFSTNTPTGDRALIVSATASINSGNVDNYNGKIGFLNTGSLDLSLVVAVNTTGKTNIEVDYDIMTIRNPYDGTSNTRINEVTLQYRVGTTGSFTTLTGMEYQSNTTLQTTATTTPQNLKSKAVILPAACNGQSVVQIRWISRQVSGAGARPSFAVDNITIDQSGTKTVAVAGTADAYEDASPVAGSFTVTFNPSTTVSTTFDYSFSGTATFGTDYTVTLDGGATPSSLTTSSGTVTVPSGNSVITATVTPINDNINEGVETVGLTISNPSNNYSVSTATSSINLFDDEATPIHTIQGSGSAATPGLFTVEAIVTGYYPNLSPGGFYIQEEDADADADPNTSEGLFVVSSAVVSVGDQVRVIGTVQENSSSPSFGQAVIYNAKVTILSSGNPLPTITDITLPVSAVSDFEKYEGMLVHFTDQLTVTENYNLGHFGEINLSQGGLVYQPTQLVDPNDDPASGTTYSGSSNVAAVTALALANANRTILLDDGTETMTTLPYVNSDNTLRLGSTVDDLTGILGFGFSVYRIQPIPTNWPSFTYAPRPDLPDLGTHNITVASMNVLNFFNGDGTGGGFPTARGADSYAEFVRQRAKIVNAITDINADVVGLTEVENDGTGATSALQDIVNGLNANLGAGTYAFINDGATTQTNSTDLIRCAILYKPATVRPHGAVMIGSDPIFNRPPVAQAFTAIATCSNFNYIINHFKSKSNDAAHSAVDDDQLDGQSFFNNKRKLQASALVDFITNVVVPATGTDRTISMGDYNSYYEEDPMDFLRASGFTVESTPTEYSYLFSGQIGSLDYGVSSPSLHSLISGSAKWNINAAEPTLLDYDDNINDGSGDFVNQWGNTYTTIPNRSSDHDPVLIGLNFPSESPSVSLSVTPSNNINTGGVATNLYIGYGPKSATISATPSGNDFTYSWSPSTNLSCANCQNPVFTPTAAGSYTFTVTATNGNGCTADASVTFCVKDVTVANGNNKVRVCHNGNTISVSSNAVPAQLAHPGDRLGSCDDDCNTSHKIAAGESDVHNMDVKVYPNPASDNFYVQVPSGIDNISVSMIDVTGKLVAQRNANGGETINFTTANLAKGVYTIIVRYGDINYSTKMTIF